MKLNAEPGSVLSWLNMAITFAKAQLRLYSAMIDIFESGTYVRSTKAVACTSDRHDDGQAC
jgi:hypothetical protein